LSNLDFCISNDERIKSYMTYQDWNDELYEANEKQWIVDQNKFDEQYIVRKYGIESFRCFIYLYFCHVREGPFVYLSSANGNDSYDDLVRLYFCILFMYLFNKKDLALDAYI
jgi:hypothetical protein